EATGVTTSSFTISWASVPGATGYQLDVSDQGDFSSFISGYENAFVTQTTITVSNLSPNLQYHCRVKATNGTYTSNSSLPQSILLFPSPPNQPSASSVTSNSLNVTWESVENAIGYRLDVSRNSEFTDIISEFNDIIVNNTSHSVSGLLSNTEYFFRVRTENPRGTSANSQAGNATTLPRPPLSP